MISANRNPEVYRGYGVPVLADADTDYPGPLAGFLAGLTHCRTDWMATVPCDTPRFPEDLVATLAAAAGDARAVVAVTEEAGERQRQSVFCLLKADLHVDLAAYLAEGGRKIERWLERQGCVDVLFDDANAFFNANTIDELRRLGGA
jgi:molybdopterin-guanine dinucleotide biosynthesis protein A